MKNIFIRSWVGRLGNNILQVKHALHIAHAYEYNIILPKHNYLNTIYIVMNKDIKKNYPKLTDTEEFYLKHKIQFVNPEIFTQNLTKVIASLQAIFKYPLPQPQRQPQLVSNPLVIHIRSGDIFTASPHPDYIMPPLSYYCRCIEFYPNSPVILLAEDTANPCIPALLQKYPYIQYNQQSLEKDIQIILDAQTIVCSYGSMINSLILLSSKIQTIYTSSYNFPIDHPSITIHTMDLEEYKQLQSPWKNTAQQRTSMLTYTSSQSFTTHTTNITPLK